METMLPTIMTTAVVAASSISALLTAFRVSEESKRLESRIRKRDIIFNKEIASLEASTPSPNEGATYKDAIQEQAATITTPQKTTFETEQLANYYTQALTQARLSFYFSLVFASLGFAVIVTAVFMYTGNIGATAVQTIAGVIMESVASLFFVQSRRTQEAMGQFFDKLRRDRDSVESRKLCNEVADPQVRDALRVRLSLHHAGIDPSSFHLVSPSKLLPPTE